MGDQESGVSRADVWAMVLVGCAVAVAAVAGVVTSAVGAVRGDPLEITVRSATDAPVGELDIALGGDRLGQGIVDSVSVLVGGIPGWVYTVEVGIAVTAGLLMLTIATCLVLLTRRLGRGRAFGRFNTWLVGSVLIAVVLWWAAGLVRSAVRFAGAFESAAGDDWRAAGLSPVMDVPLAPVLVAVGLLPVVVAFRLGERLQRDAEGLV